uniref:FERM domain-containing protein n=1 Tax=Heterorhabditis bacteriophora TaxID=37862 RepID=A0A1I7XG34_HETBA
MAINRRVPWTLLIDLFPKAEMSGIPRGVGAPPPPGMDSKRGKLMCIKVRMLDDTVAVFHLGHKAVGQTLLDEVARHLNLLENDYFGLEFIDSIGNHVSIHLDLFVFLISLIFEYKSFQCWLDREKPILRQISTTNSDAKFYFIVKFYTPNPVDLEEEYTRYLMSLQIRRDLSVGDLQCAESTAALLAAYLVQSDCGDFSADDYPDASYLSHSRFIPHQTIQFQQKVMENHRNLVGMSPGESDLALLEVARRCDFYGIKFHTAKQYYKETIEFVFDNRNECKNFWKKCVEHHAFFRCSTVDGIRRDHRLFSKGSSFRYHGRTQKQLIDYVREHHKRREPFTRSLRSGVSSHCGPSTAIYSVVSDKKKNGRTHTSMPHLPNQSTLENSGTLDARSRPKKRSPSDRCTSDVESHEKPKHRDKQREQIDHRDTENMSLSLPNVLSDDIQVVCRELEIESKEPPKSASGDNFLDINSTRDYDNVSEDSYRLSDHERSTRSDVGVNPQVYQTTFTTKRIGNVIVKRVVSQSKSTPNTTDDEDGTSHADSSSRLSRPRRIKEYPFNTTNMIPIEIDGPNVDSSTRKSQGPIYTSSGALLLKPTILSTGKNVKSALDSNNYSTIITQPVQVTSDKSNISKSTDNSSPNNTYGATGPLPGKVITKENMIITPEGVNEKRQKPTPPPKFKKPIVPPHATLPQASFSTESSHPVVHMVGDEPLRAKSEEVPQKVENSCERRIPLSRPALISVQSEDNPDIKKCHLFNSEIPYTLTMRNVDSAESVLFSTFKNHRELFESHSLKRLNKSPDQFKRRKSLDLVPRKRLPSPGNYSSQDHTISPTTPDGDVLEYLLRRRSMSNDRSALSKKDKRGDLRRQTQPVRFDLPPSPCSPTAGGSTPFIGFLNDDVTDDCVSESRSLHDDMEKLEKTQTQSLLSLGGERRENSDDSDVLPPPPETVSKPPPPPPPPKPKGVAERVSEIKITTSVLTTSKVEPLTIEKIRADIEKKTNSISMPCSEEQQVEPQSPSTEDSPSFIDDSPKSSEESLPTSRRTKTGLLWTDF